MEFHSPLTRTMFAFFSFWFLAGYIKPMPIALVSFLSFPRPVRVTALQFIWASDICLLSGKKGVGIFCFVVVVV